MATARVEALVEESWVRDLFHDVAERLAKETKSSYTLAIVDRTGSDNSVTIAEVRIRLTIRALLYATTTSEYSCCNIYSSASSKCTQVLRTVLRNNEDLLPGVEAPPVQHLCRYYLLFAKCSVQKRSNNRTTGGESPILTCPVCYPATRNKEVFLGFLRRFEQYMH